MADRALATGACNYPDLYAFRAGLLYAASQFIAGMARGHDIIDDGDMQCSGQAVHGKRIAQVEPPCIGTQQ